MHTCEILEQIEQNSINNIVAMKINVLFEFNNSSADTNLERRH